MMPLLNKGITKYVRELFEVNNRWEVRWIVFDFQGSFSNNGVENKQFSCPTQT